MRERPNAYTAHEPGRAYARYRGLARDGISCAARRRMALTAEQFEKVGSQSQNRCVKERQDFLNPDNKGFAASSPAASSWASPAT